MPPHPLFTSLYLSLPLFTSFYFFLAPLEIHRKSSASKAKERAHHLCVADGGRAERPHHLCGDPTARVATTKRRVVAL